MIECKHRSLIRSVGKLHYANTSSLISHKQAARKVLPNGGTCLLCPPALTPIFSYNSATRSNIRLKLFGQHSFLFGRTCGMPFSSDQKLMVPVTLHEKHNKQRARFTVMHTSIPSLTGLPPSDPRDGPSLQRHGTAVPITINIYAVRLSWSWSVICIKPWSGFCLSQGHLRDIWQSARQIPA